MSSFVSNNKAGIHQMCYCLKCFDNKNVVTASSDAEIYSVVQGDMKTRNSLCHKKLGPA
jgi:hypothetical protein